MNILPDEHYEELKFSLEFLKIFKDATLTETKQFGFHWSICPYTSEPVEDVPDTCICTSADLKIDRIAKLMNLYENIVKIKNK